MIKFRLLFPILLTHLIFLSACNSSDEIIESKQFTSLTPISINEPTRTENPSIEFYLDVGDNKNIFLISMVATPLINNKNNDYYYDNNLKISIYDINNMSNLY